MAEQVNRVDESQRDLTLSLITDSATRESSLAAWVAPARA